jgi:uncharacterized protein YkwD
MRKIINIILILILGVMAGSYGNTKYIAYQKAQAQKIIDSKKCAYELKVGSFNGQDLFEAVNCYRGTKGLPPFQQDSDLCDNLAQRYYDYMKPENQDVAHPEFEKWAKSKLVDGFEWVAENSVVNATTLENTINGWAGSPGHYAVLTKDNAKRACTYAVDGFSLLVIGIKPEDFN